MKERNEKGFNSVVFYIIFSKKQIKTIIIPFFKQNSLYSIKNHDFWNWDTLINMSDNKTYNTLQGRLKMLDIIKNINSGRVL
jgi:hypothetical protein